MTSTELQSVIGVVVEALHANRDIITTDILDEFQKFVNGMRTNVYTYVRQDFDVEKFLHGMDKVIEVERKLIGQDGLTVIKLLDTIKERKWLLAIIGRFV